MIRNQLPRTAVITGAAGGFGNCFAERLAAQGFDLILIDRRKEDLIAMCDRLESEHQIVTEAMVLDLTDQNSVKSLADHLALRCNIEFLINNVGFAHLRDFVDIHVDRHLDMVALHVTTPMLLTRAVLPGMIHRDSGNIINVSSLGAWLPSGDAQYAATKSYLLVLSQSLHEEVFGTGVRIQALCPSFSDTGFHNTDEMKRFPRQSIPRRLWMTPQAVVDCSLNALGSGQPLVIPGWKNRIFSIGLRMPLLQPIIKRFMRRRKPTVQNAKSHSIESNLHATG